MLRQRLIQLECHESIKEAAKIIDRLQNAGFEALLAGGCVRDALLGRTGADVDIATSARPEDVEKLFDKTLAVGKAFGTMVVATEKESFEVTTFRQDGPYLDGRHPSSVRFTSAKEDALRRDFTINALFYDLKKNEVVDYVEGLKDLKDGVIRAVGDPKKRFKEDHLRMLRAVRFASQLGFDIESKTWTAIGELAAKIKDVSKERVLQELMKLLKGKDLRRGFERLVCTHLADHIWPSVAQLALDKKRWDDFLKRCAYLTQPESILATMAWLSGDRDGFFKDLEVLKPPRALIQNVQRLMQMHEGLWRKPVRKGVRVGYWADSQWLGLLEMAEAEASEQSCGAKRLQEWISEYLNVCDKKGELPKAFLNGQDLIRLGFKPGPEMGKALEELYLLQLEGQITTKFRAEAMGTDYLRHHRC